MTKIYELEELREDVIEGLRKLIGEIDSMDYDSIHKIGVAIGAIEEPVDGIEINLTYDTDCVSQFFPHGTPKSILQDCLVSIEGSMVDRANYDGNDMLLILKDDMYETFSNHISETIKNKFGFSFIENIVSKPDDEDYMLVLTALDQDQKGVELLVKLEEDNVYSVWEVKERHSYEDFDFEQVDLILIDAKHVGDISLSEEE